MRFASLRNSRLLGYNSPPCPPRSNPFSALKEPSPAVSGGRAVGLAGEWEDGDVRPLSVWADGRLVALR